LVTIADPKECAHKGRKTVEVSIRRKRPGRGASREVCKDGTTPYVKAPLHKPKR
jgi:hypothetical protein